MWRAEGLAWNTLHRGTSPQFLVCFVVVVLVRVLVLVLGLVPVVSCW